MNSKNRETEIAEEPGHGYAVQPLCKCSSAEPPPPPPLTLPGSATSPIVILASKEVEQKNHGENGTEDWIGWE